MSARWGRCHSVLNARPFLKHLMVLVVLPHGGKFSPCFVFQFLNLLKDIDTYWNVFQWLQTSEIVHFYTFFYIWATVQRICKSHTPLVYRPVCPPTTRWSDRNFLVNGRLVNKGSTKKRLLFVNWIPGRFDCVSPILTALVGLCHCCLTTLACTSFSAHKIVLFS